MWSSSSWYSSHATVCDLTKGCYTPALLLTMLFWLSLHFFIHCIIDIKELIILYKDTFHQHWRFIDMPWMGHDSTTHSKSRKQTQMCVSLHTHRFDEWSIRGCLQPGGWLLRREMTYPWVGKYNCSMSTTDMLACTNQPPGTDCWSIGHSQVLPVRMGIDNTSGQNIIYIYATGPRSPCHSLSTLSSKDGSS